MICDPTIEVCCDTCSESVYIELEYKYNDYSGNSGQYNTSDEFIEEQLVSHHEWIVEDGNHYCCESCKSEK